jgi:hypothetical protein
MLAQLLMTNDSVKAPRILAMNLKIIIFANVDGLRLRNRPNFIHSARSTYNSSRLRCGAASPCFGLGNPRDGFAVVPRRQKALIGYMTNSRANSIASHETKSVFNCDFGLSLHLEEIVQMAARHLLILTMSCALVFPAFVQAKDRDKDRAVGVAVGALLGVAIAKSRERQRQREIDRAVDQRLRERDLDRRESVYERRWGAPYSPARNVVCYRDSETCFFRDDFSMRWTESEFGRR